MHPDTETVRVVWRSVWYSRYLRGSIMRSSRAIERIYKHKDSGQIRIYSAVDWHNVQLSVNEHEAIRMESRGRFGKLYIGAGLLTP